MPNLLSDMPKLTDDDINQINYVRRSASGNGEKTRQEIGFIDKDKLHEDFVHYYKWHYSFPDSGTRDTYEKLYGERPHVKEDKERDRKKTLRSTTPFGYDGR